MIIGSRSFILPYIHPFILPRLEILVTSCPNCPREEIRVWGSSPRAAALCSEQGKLSKPLCCRSIRSSFERPCRRPLLRSSHGKLHRYTHTHLVCSFLQFSILLRIFFRSCLTCRFVICLKCWTFARASGSQEERGEARRQGPQERRRWQAEEEEVEQGKAKGEGEQHGLVRPGYLWQVVGWGP